MLDEARQDISDLCVRRSCGFVCGGGDALVGRRANVDSINDRVCAGRRNPHEAYAVDDWDGYDARPITAETLDAARSILKSLPKSFGDPVCSPGAD